MCSNQQQIITSNWIYFLLVGLNLVVSPLLKGKFLIFLIASIADADVHYNDYVIFEGQMQYQYFFQRFHSDHCSTIDHMIAQYDCKHWLHWHTPLTPLKLQVCLRKESLQWGHISSPRMFKSWDRTSFQASCAGVFLPLCLGSLFSFSLSPFCLPQPSSKDHLKESKHSINNLI